MSAGEGNLSNAEIAERVRAETQREYLDRVRQAILEASSVAPPAAALAAAAGGAEGGGGVRMSLSLLSQQALAGTIEALEPGVGAALLANLDAHLAMRAVLLAFERELHDSCAHHREHALLARHPLRGRIREWVDEKMRAFVAAYKYKNQFQLHQEVVHALRDAALPPAPLAQAPPLPPPDTPIALASPIKLSLGSEERNHHLLQSAYFLERELKFMRVRKAVGRRRLPAHCLSRVSLLWSTVFVRVIAIHLCRRRSLFF